MCISQIEFHRKRNTTTLTNLHKFFSLFLRICCDMPLLLFRSNFPRAANHSHLVFFSLLLIQSANSMGWVVTQSLDFFLSLFQNTFIRVVCFLFKKKSFLSIVRSSIVKIEITSDFYSVLCCLAGCKRLEKMHSAQYYVFFSFRLSSLLLFGK